MREQKEIEIKGTKYLLTQFDGMFGLSVLQKVQAIFIPAWAQMQREIINGNEAAFVDMVAALSPKLAELDSGLIKQVIEKGATRNSVQIDFARDFAGKYMEMLSLLKEILMFNFKDVFQELGFGEAEPLEV